MRIDIMQLIIFISALICTTLCPAANELSSGATRLTPTARHTKTADPRRPTTAAVDFSALILKTLKEDMPTGGGYDSGQAATDKLSEAVAWGEEEKTLHISPNIATPSFCSGACYLLLVKTLQNWEQNLAGKLSPEVWQLLAVQQQADGIGVWGRANANGPGFSKMVHDLRVGVNFTDIRKARPGDFLKFFWTKEIGAKEHGHLVVYLGYKRKGGELYITYWSANKPDGYGMRRVKASAIHNLIFTRITNPQNFNNAIALPQSDKWLQDMLQKSFTFTEVCQKIGVPAGSPAQKSKRTPD